MDSPLPKRQKTQSVEMEPSSPDERDGIPELEDAPELPDPRFYHFKILYDQTWDYPKICEKFFMKEHKYLCVLEHVNQPNTHVHFQGMSLLAPPTVKARLTRLVKTHHLRTLNPKCRPASMSARPVDVVGFQYMAKEMKKEYILASNLFTPEELQELKDKSLLHCTKLKTCIKDYIAGLPKATVDIMMQSASPNDMIERVGHGLFIAAGQGQIELPEYNKHHTRASVIRGLMANPHLSEKWKGKLYVL